MKDCNLKEVVTPVENIADPLTELLRKGARDLIRQAVEAELGAMLSEYEDLNLIDGRQGGVTHAFTAKRSCSLTKASRRGWRTGLNQLLRPCAYVQKNHVTVAQGIAR